MPDYQNAQYVKDPLTGIVNMIRVQIDGAESFVPMDPANTDYRNMMQLVDEGKLVIAPAE